MNTLLKAKFFIIAIIIISINALNLYAVDSMYIDTNGNVGIGTITPAGKLNVVDGTHLQILTSNGKGPGGVYTKNSLTVYGNSDTGYSTLRITSDHSPVTDRGLLNIDRMGNSYLYVRMDGNVGIGTTSPAYKLDINGNMHAKNGAYIENGMTVTGNAEFMGSAYIYNATLGQGARINFPKIYSSNNSYYFNLNDSGKLAIYTSGGTLIWTSP